MKALLTVWCLMFATQAFAFTPDEVLKDGSLEARARVISKELRFMVCQNQSIDDSDAQLAKDLRIVVRERLQAGDTDAQIFDFVEARYGAFVLLKPRLNAQTIMLWVSPVLVVLAGLALIWRRKATIDETGPIRLTDEEELRVRNLLNDYKS